MKIQGQTAKENWRASMAQQFAELAKSVDNIRSGRPILFAINPGNWGDSLIREGTERFFNHFEIPYQTVEISALIAKRADLQTARMAFGECQPILVINGCGAFTKKGRRVPFMAKMSHSFEETIILPASYEIAPQNEFDWRNTHFFARDQDQSIANVPSAAFCHDMAFFLDSPKITPSKETGNFFRTDNERSGSIKLPKSNVDISRKGKFHTPIDGFFSAIGTYQTIRTDRLHVAIAGAILDRDVQFFANSYFKNNSVYRSSMEGFFPNVKFFPTETSVTTRQTRIRSLLKFFGLR